MPARSIRCPECRTQFEVDPRDARIGHAQCPECRAMVTVRGGGGGGGGGSSRSRGGSGLGCILAIVAIISLSFLGCCGGIIALFWYQIKPTDFPEQTQDYADARKTFKTTLTNTGKAPQGYNENEKSPEGVKEITYKSGELKLKAWVKPPDAQNKKDGLKPAVLYLHGGFALSSEDWDQCKPFRDAGFVTMTPALRAENGQAGSFTLFYDEVDDVVAAAEALAATPGVDPNRIFVAGHSAGGTLAMLAAMTSKRFKGCVSFSGSPDQKVFVQLGEVEPPFDADNQTELMMRSPLAFPKSFNCPARLYWGQDELFAFGFATRKLAEKAQAAGKDVQSVEIPGDHFTSVGPAMSQAVTFFQQENLKVK